MTERRRLLLLVLIMTCVSLIVGGIAIVVLYRTAIAQTRQRLVETAQSQARLIEAVARFNEKYSRNFPAGSEAATLSQIVDAHEHYQGFGTTGEFTLARRDGDKIVFLLRHRHGNLESPKSVEWKSNLAEPMRQALMGKSSTLIGLDYRGKKVLAAYEPVAELNLGIVAKIDLWEVQWPFVKAALVGLCSSLLVVVFGAALFLRISNPMILRLVELDQLSQQELTKKEEAQKQVVDRESRLRAILHSAVDGIITIDDHGIIESCNPAALELFGYSNKKLIGQNIKILMPSPYFEEHDGYLARYKETGQGSVFRGREVDGQRKDGSVFPMDISVSKLTLEGQTYFTGIVRDISERKQNHRRLMQSERLAAIGQMSTGLAHESRNALQRMQACLEMLKIEIEDRPEALRLAGRIELAQDQLTHLFEEVRSYAAPISLDRTECKLSQIWRDNWLNLELARSAKEIQLHEQIEGVDLQCNIDPYAMGQVFRNILENAISACPQSGEVVISAAESTSDKKSSITIKVRDNGPGIEPQKHKQVFEPFYTTKTKGTGLGMAIARRIVEAHGGNIDVSEGDSPGAEFIVILPRNGS